LLVQGQSLPIARNGSNGKGGVNQKLLLDFSRYIAAGEWCHIFPEAAIYQLKTGALGGRGYPLQLANEEQEFIVDDTTTLKRELALKGNLKWGIGKMIAHSPVAPVVIPFHHMGMDDIIPQNPFTRKTLPRPPNMFGNTLRIKFGPKVDVSDLIEAHEAKYGKLWKYSPSYSQDKYQYMIQNKGGNHVSDCEKSEASMKDAIKGNFDFHKIWDSSEEELLLYHLITRRIESAIERLSDHEQK
jgi:monolysocardiolipin acyltransferase